MPRRVSQVMRRTNTRLIDYLNYAAAANSHALVELITLECSLSGEQFLTALLKFCFPDIRLIYKYYFTDVTF